MNRFDLSWKEKLSVAWEVFIKIFAFVNVVLYALSALLGVGAFLYFLFSGKLL